MTADDEAEMRNQTLARLATQKDVCPTQCEFTIKNSQSTVKRYLDDPNSALSDDSSSLRLIIERELTPEGGSPLDGAAHSRGRLVHGKV